MQSIYVHIPFCLQKCHYCDFFSLGVGEKPIDQAGYVRAIGMELERWSKVLSLRSGGSLKTLFLGGGTPSLLDPEQVAEIIRLIDKYFPIGKNTEVTMEVNPKTVDLKKLKGFFQAGVVRVSMGMQSLEDRLLQTLGRAHSGEMALQTLNWLFEAGFPKVSLDLMYGLPQQKVEDMERTLKALELFPLTHLSAYELIIEENTPFYQWWRRNQLTLPATERVLIMEGLIKEFAECHQMHPYEISNYSAPGFECQHNLAYWNYHSFLGLGAGAVSFLRTQDLLTEFSQSLLAADEGFSDSIRFTNVKNVPEYQQSSWSWNPVHLEKIFKGTARGEYMMMGLRKKEGVRFKDYQLRFDEPFPEEFKKILARFYDKSWLSFDQERVWFNAKGFLYSNEVMREFF